MERRAGIVLTQGDGSTGIKGIFAGGDLTSNQRTVAHAISSGKKAALAMDCYLKGKESEEAIHRILVGEGPSLSIFRYLHPDERPRNPHIVTFEELNMDYFESSKRCRESKGLVKKRIKGFGEVTSCFTESLALEEAERCFSCGSSAQMHPSSKQEKFSPIRWITIFAKAVGSVFLNVPKEPFL
jgi:hypothetical protein